MKAAVRTGVVNAEKAVVFYDGGCSLCQREINHYRGLRGAETLRWVDIVEDSSVLSHYGLSRDEAMARFHVLAVDGEWHTGAWGFVELWTHLPAYKRLARLLRAAGLIPILDCAYTAFARWRLRRRCDTGSCAAGEAK